MASAMGQGEELMVGPVLLASSPDIVVPRGRVSLGGAGVGRVHFGTEGVVVARV